MKSRNSRLFVAVLLVVVSAAVVGGVAGVGASASTTLKTPKIGVIVKTFANQYWTAVRAGAESAAAKYNVDFITVDAATTESNTQEQATKTDAMVNGDYTCLVAAPITGTNLIQSLAAATKKGIPVINIDTKIDPAQAASAGLKVATFISSNNINAGKKGGQQMVKFLGGKKEAKGAQLAIIGGIAGDPNSNAVITGYKQGIKGSGARVVQTGIANWDRTQALTLASSMLKKHPNIKGFMVANDGMALGVVSAVFKAHKKGVYVIGVDGDLNSLKSELKGVKHGGQAASVAQSPFTMGALGVEACIAAVNGKVLPSFVASPTFVVTQANAATAIARWPAPPVTSKDPLAGLL